MEKSPYEPQNLECKTFRILTEEGIFEIHRLKTLPEFYEAIASGVKTAEFRKLDRDYKVRDFIQLEEWRDEYTGRMMWKKITHILENFEGFERGYGMLSFDLATDPWRYAYHVQELD